MRRSLPGNILLLVLFAGMITFPLINERVNLIQDIESFENRALAKKPVFDINHLDNFPLPYDTFYNDHFTLRNRLIRYYNIYEVEAYRKSPSPSVVIGRDGWLYVAKEEMDSYMGKNRLKPEELLSIRRELEFRKKYLADRGIKFYFMVVPCKASIHSEHIGYEYFRMSKESWGEQLNHYLQRTSKELKPIDLFDSLRLKAKSEDLFFRLDNHWNSLGAFYTCNEFIKVASRDLPQLRPLSKQDYEVKFTRNATEGNLDRMTGGLGIFKESSLDMSPKHGFKSQPAPKVGYPPTPGFPYPDVYEQEREIHGSGQPRLLIIGDSFTGAILPFISENFSRTVNIFDSWQYALHEDIIEKEHPDAVLLMINEPILRNLLDHHSGPGN